MKSTGPTHDVRPFAEIAQNATTRVFKAYQASLDRIVLLKRLRPEYARDEDLARRFQEEARLVARVHHPNVAAIHAFGRDDEGAYIVAEFVDGFDLGEIIRLGPVPAAAALFILLECARGLKAAHDRDVLHRDLKPSNVLISREGEVKLVDFGLASAMGPAPGSPAEVRGTLGYLAPEQILGRTVDRRSDLFALGATCYEMLTGRRAFPGSDSNQIFDAILNRDPTTAFAAKSGPEARAEAVCRRLMARDPEARYDDAGALIAALEDSPGIIGRTELASFLKDPDSWPAGSERGALSGARMLGTSGRIRGASAPRDAELPDVRVVPDPPSGPVSRGPVATERPGPTSGRAGREPVAAERPGPTSEEISGRHRIGKSIRGRRWMRVAGVGAFLAVLGALAYAGAMLMDGRTEVASSDLVADGRPAETERMGAETGESAPGFAIGEDAGGTVPGTDAPDHAAPDGSESRTGEAFEAAADIRADEADGDAGADVPTSTDLVTPAAPAGSPQDLVPTGTIDVRVDPGAAVFVDEDSVGVATTTAPLIVQAEAGTRRVLLRNPHFPAHPEEVVVHPNETTRLEVSLFDGVGWLHVRVFPWAYVYVNGDLLGETPVEPHMLPPGVHRLRLVHPGYGADHTRDVRVGRGDTVLVEVDVTRL